MQPQPLILASASPRRIELLTAMGLDARAISSNVTEADIGEPAALAMDNARRKAESVHESHRDAWVLGADTIVVLDNNIYGKPSDESDAMRMLCALQGRTHVVITGVCLVAGPQLLCDNAQTSVTFSPMTTSEIKAYLATGESMDKAGAYGIQGMMRMYVESITGSYDNVMGLPTALVRRMLLSNGYNWLETY